MLPLTPTRGCTGGECPGCWPADDPGQLLIRGYTVPAAAQVPPGRGPGETDIVIDRALVAAALIPADQPATLADLRRSFETFAYSAFRLETGDYENSGPDEGWYALLRRNRGKTHQRVHVVTEPLTLDTCRELTEGYPGSIAAGEDIRIIPVPGVTAWPADIPGSDFWLFDSIKLYRMDYQAGRFAGAVRIFNPAAIMQAGLARDAALNRGIPWAQYMDSRPDLKRAA